MALRLQEQGKFVLGIGEKEKSSPILLDSCNEFLYVEDIPAVDEKIIEALSVPASVEEKENGRLVLLSFITEVLKVTKKREDGFVFLSDFGIAVTTYKSDFNYRSYGFNSLKKMIESFGDEFEIISDGREKPAYLFRMRTADHEEFGQSQKTMKLQGKVKRIIFNYGIITADDGDYFYYIGDVAASDREKLTKNTAVSFIASKHPCADAAETKDRNGKAVEVQVS